MEPNRERSTGSRIRPESWGRIGVAALLVGAVVLAMVVVRAGSSPDAGVRASRSDSPGGTTSDTSQSDSTDVPTTEGTDSTVPPCTLPSSTSDFPDTSETPVTLPPHVDDPEAALADQNFFVDWLPELRNMAAPSWVSQGTRLSYYASAASVPGSYHQYVEDENGGWIDPDTGERYRQEDIPSASGHGYNQVSVTALNDAVAVLSIRVYGLTDLDLSSPVTTLTWGGAVGLPGAGSDYWLHPVVLATIDEIVSSSLKIVRMPYSIGDTQYSSIWIQSIGDSGNYTWVFDLDSGALLHTASSTTGAPLGGPVAEGEGREGSTFLTQSTLVGVRQTALPWAMDTAPDWIGSISRIEYTGTMTVDVAPSVVLNSSLVVDRLSSGTGWARYLFSRTTYSDVAPSVTEYLERIDGAGQVGGLWLPPDGLAALSPGQELDRDPITQAVVSVASVDPSDSGTTVTIVDTGPAEESVLAYDVQTGLLLSSRTDDMRLGTHIEYLFSNWS